MIYKLGIFALLLASCIAPSPTTARTITVGSDSDCDFADFQSALDAMKDHDEVHVSSKTFSGLHLHIVDRAVAIIGGFDSCSSPESGGGRTILKGSGGGDSTLLIDGSSNVTLKYFSFFGTTLVDASTHGAGINYRGHGSLSLEHVSILFNVADYGAGLNVSASDATDVYFNEDTLIANNIAYKQGGGVNIEGKTHLYMSGNNSSISYNTASGNGGGIQINGPAIAEIGSPGDANGAISHNKAGYGGGVAIEPGGLLRLYSTDSNAPVSISDNAATVAGGGIHVRGSLTYLCGWVYSIDRNTAPDGAAIYSDGNGDGNVLVLLPPSNSTLCTPQHLTPSACPGGRSCNTISDNVSTQSESGTIALAGPSEIQMESFEMRGNTAYHAIRQDEIRSNSSYENCLIADNLLRANTLDVLDSTSDFWHTSIQACTFALNSSNDNAASAINSNAAIDIRQSILWEPGHTLLSGSGTRTGQFLLVNESDSFFGISDLIKASDPGFVYPGVDYHLRLDSPGLDYLSGTNLSYTGATLDGYLRGNSLIASRVATPFDLGPYERQTASTPQTFPLAENFDELDPTGADLPTGWSNNFFGANAGWFATSDADAGSMYAMHTADPGAVGEAILTSPGSSISGLLIFKHKYQLEPTFDVALLEVSTDGSEFKDILDAGGRFISGGYDNIMAPGSPANPIKRVGKPVWSNDFGAVPYSTVKVALPSVPAGQQLQLRWRVGSDGSGEHGGYWLDSVQLVTDAIFTDSVGG